jgi:hypothetical protein
MSEFEDAKELKNYFDRNDHIIKVINKYKSKYYSTERIGYKLDGLAHSIVMRDAEISKFKTELDLLEAFIDNLSRLNNLDLENNTIYSEIITKDKSIVNGFENITLNKCKEIINKTCDTIKSERQKKDQIEKSDEHIKCKIAYFESIRKIVRDLLEFLNKPPKKIELSLDYFENIYFKVHNIEEKSDDYDKVLNDSGIKKKITELKRTLDSLKKKEERLRKRIQLPYNGIKIHKELELHEETQQKCKNIIIFYKDYLQNQIWFVNSIHVDFYLNKICNKFKKYLNKEEEDDFSYLKADILYKNIDYDRHNHFAKHRVFYMALFFYFFLFLMDGFIWGQIVLSPILSNIELFEGFGANILHFFASESSNLGDLVFVLSFHALSFIIVVIISRIPAILSFYLKTFDNINRALKVQDISNFPYKSKFRVAPFVLLPILKLNKPLRSTIIYTMIFIWYTIFSLIPLSVISIENNFNENIQFYSWNMAFWFFIHLLYKCIGGYSFVVGKIPYGELREWVQDFLIRNPGKIQKTRLSYLDMRDTMIKLDIKNMRSKLLIIEGDIDNFLAKYNYNSLASTILTKNIKRNEENLNQLKKIEADFQKIFSPIYDTLYDFKKLINLKKISIDELINFNTEDIYTKLKEYQ